MGQAESVQSIDDHFQVFRLQNDQNALLRSLKDQSEYLMRVVTCSNQCDIDRIRGLHEERAQIKNNHIFSLVDVKEKTHKHLCSIHYKMYVILSYSFKNIAQQIRERVAEEKKRLFVETDLWSILYSCCIALHTLYGKGATHQCLTASQIFINRDGFVKITEPLLFGLEKNHLRAMRTQNEGKIDVHLSPQTMNCLQNQNFFFYSKEKSDVFILAMIIADIALLTENYLYDPIGKTANLHLIESVLSRMAEQFSSNLTDLLRQMLMVSPKDRPSLSEIIEKIERHQNLTRDAKDTEATVVQPIHLKTGNISISLKDSQGDEQRITNSISHVFFNNNSTHYQQNKSARPVNYSNVRAPSIEAKTVLINAPIQVVNSFYPTTTRIICQNPQTIARKMEVSSHRQRSCSTAPTKAVPLGQQHRVANKTGIAQQRNEVGNHCLHNFPQTSISQNQTIRNVNKNSDVQVVPNVIVNGLLVMPKNIAEISQSNQFAQLKSSNRTDRKESTFSSNWLTDYKAKNNLTERNHVQIQSKQQIAGPMALDSRSSLQQCVTSDPVGVSSASAQRYNINFDSATSCVYNRTISTNGSQSGARHVGTPSKFDFGKPNDSFACLPSFSHHSYFQNNEESEFKLKFVRQQIPEGTYEGYKLNSERSDHGCLYLKEGGRYEGEWRCDKMHGFGKLVYQSGRVAYEGHWEDGKYNGQGRLYNEDPFVFTGDYNYKDLSQLSGRWQYYDGQFKNGARNGKGYIKLTNGQIYQGIFDKDTIEGSGVFYRRSEGIIIGFWIAGKLFLNQTYERKEE